MMKSSTNIQRAIGLKLSRATRLVIGCFIGQLTALKAMHALLVLIFTIFRWLIWKLFLELLSSQDYLFTVETRRIPHIEAYVRSLINFFRHNNNHCVKSTMLFLITTLASCEILYWSNISLGFLISIFLKSGSLAALSRISLMISASFCLGSK